MIYQSNEEHDKVNPEYRFTFYYDLPDPTANFQDGFNWITTDLRF